MKCDKYDEIYTLFEIILPLQKIANIMAFQNILDNECNDILYYNLLSKEEGVK